MSTRLGVAASPEVAAASPYTLCARDAKRTERASDFIMNCKKQIVVPEGLYTLMQMDVRTEGNSDHANERTKV